MLGLVPLAELAAAIPTVAAEQTEPKFKPVQWVECPDCTATLRVFEGSEPICGYCRAAEAEAGGVRVISFGGGTVVIGVDPDAERRPVFKVPEYNWYNQSAEWHNEISAGKPYDGDATCDVITTTEVEMDSMFLPNNSMSISTEQMGEIARRFARDGKVAIGEGATAEPGGIAIGVGAKAGKV